MTFVRREDGRLLVRVTLPTDVVERADEMAQASDHDRADLLGDLVASQLPEVLSEAATELLTQHEVEPPALPGGATKSDEIELAEDDDGGETE
ncbi:MAG: hypothetical protein IVW52_18855 [Acidimicrobiales bacterium]|nr:hypothetical protein [Acidimicrobiales bacterium]